MERFEPTSLENGIAIVGLSGRFPGAKNIRTFWQNLCQGVESISFFSREELEAAGVDTSTYNAPYTVKAGGVLEDVDLFDAAFFDFTPREAEITDPQQRLFLECAWEAMEDAGYDPATYAGRIGVYAGSSMSTYLFHLHTRPDIIQGVDALQLLIGNDKDHLTTRVCYKLNLRGPGVTISTTCSTSLVAVHLACQSLLDYHCDMVLAGGVSVNIPQEVMYTYQEGGIISPDGHCRAFDRRAGGTIFGNGVGIVVLKRLSDALADNDSIYAIIRGSAINNDGRLKSGYTAPGLEGQAEVIAEALASAEVDPATISYIETHGTGTPLGDPIEIAALTQVFRSGTDTKAFCAIGSVKTNIGHLDAAAGIAGLIKTVLALKHKVIPPSLHFEQANPHIDFASSPFYVAAILSSWQAGATPRRAGVTALGIGGTNAHIVLEEAPVIEHVPTSMPYQLIVLSARTPSALETITRNLAHAIAEHPDIDLADIAYTTQIGRRAFPYRRIVVCQNNTDLIRSLETMEPQRVFNGVQQEDSHPIVFLFPGQGTQYMHMAVDLYREVRVFRECVDNCAGLLEPLLGFDLRDVLYAPTGQEKKASSLLNQTYVTQPALFVIEYALAKLWMHWGIQPQAMIGHSIGEYVAACLAEVISLEDALKLVTLRGALMQEQPAGSMLGVPLSQQEVAQYLAQEKELSLSALNGPALCVVAGPEASINNLRQRLTEKGINCRLLQTSHAFHSTMMEPAMRPFRQFVEQVALHSPRIPYLSNVTGTWITPAETTNPDYWSRHIRETVQFSQGLNTLFQQFSDPILLEVGPGQTLYTLVKQHPSPIGKCAVLTSLRHPHIPISDVMHLLTSLGKLWLRGISADWTSLHEGGGRRVALPTYPFERQRYWVERGTVPSRTEPESAILRKEPDIADWFYLPSWKRSDLLPGERAVSNNGNMCVLVFVDSSNVGSGIANCLQQHNIEVITAQAGTEGFQALDQQRFVLCPHQPQDYERLLEELSTHGKHPSSIIHLWSLSSSQAGNGDDEASADFEHYQNVGFYSLLFLTRALGKMQPSRQRQITLITNCVQEVIGTEALYPEKATVLGLTRVIPQEYTDISCRSIDIVLPEPGGIQERKLIDSLVMDCLAPASNYTLAYRGTHRWEQTFEPVHPAVSDLEKRRLRSQGVYLITGGLGDIGLTIANHLARAAQAKLILAGRSALPPREQWEQWVNTHNEQDQVCYRIQRVRELERLGATVLLAQVDISDDEGLARIIAQGEQRFGSLHGVIHAAGTVSDTSFQSIQATEQETCLWHFRPKVQGTRAIARALQGKSLDFCLLISSLSSILGGLEFSAYAAANTCMDLFAYQQNQRGSTPWTTVNWDAWRFSDEKDRQGIAGASLRELAIRPEEGVQVFSLILALEPITQIVISTGNLRIRMKQWMTPESLQGTLRLSQEGALDLHPRPDLDSAYAEPTSEIERRIAEIWQHLLGIEQVGIYDSFFELGGHSLLATQLISRLRDAFQVSLPLNTIFEAPTIAGFAQIITRKLADQMDSELLAMLEQFEQTQTPD